MKNFKVVLAALMSLQFSMTAYANNSVSSEEQLRQTVAKVTLKNKSEELHDLIKNKWIIENIINGNAEGIYIIEPKNSWLAAALGVLATEGLFLTTNIIHIKRMNKETTLKEAMKKYLQWMKEMGREVPGLKTYLLVTGGVAGFMVYFVTTNLSETSLKTESYKKLTDSERKEEYEKIIQQIEFVSKEIVDLNKQMEK